MERLPGMRILTLVLRENALPFVLAGSDLSRHAPKVSFNFCLSLGLPSSFQTHRRETSPLCHLNGGSLLALDIWAQKRQQSWSGRLRSYESRYLRPEQGSGDAWICIFILEMWKQRQREWKRHRSDHTASKDLNKDASILSWGCLSAPKSLLSSIR